MGASHSSEALDVSDSDYDESEYESEEEEEHNNDANTSSDSESKSGVSLDWIYPKGIMMEEFEEAAKGRVKNLTLGALDQSFLVNDTGVQVFRSFSSGIHREGVFVKFDGGNLLGSSNLGESVVNKAILMRVETDMLLMSPIKEGMPHASSLHQLDLETGKIVNEWKFEKDGVDITMRDITNDANGSELDPSNSTFLGLICFVNGT
ncbi:hypothetical protein K1719_025227 [Acacia pycnantha]|nr:hypothetical protein K1719_025227 [Acacia pycnantha]